MQQTNLERTEEQNCNRQIQNGQKYRTAADKFRENSNKEMQQKIQRRQKYRTAEDKFGEDRNRGMQQKSLRGEQ